MWIASLVGCGPSILGNGGDGTGGGEESSGDEGESHDASSAGANADGDAPAGGGGGGGDRGDGGGGSSGGPTPGVTAFYVERGAGLVLTVSTFVSAACPEGDVLSNHCEDFPEQWVALEFPAGLEPGTFDMADLDGTMKDSPGYAAAGTCFVSTGSVFGSGTLQIDVVGDVIEGALVDAGIGAGAPMNVRFVAPSCAG